mgnify:CR=1 FL=1
MFLSLTPLTRCDERQAPPRHRPSSGPVLDEPVSPSACMEHRQLLERSLVGIEALPDRRRRVFLAALGPESAAAIGQREGLSTQRVRQIVCEVRAHLRTVLALGALALLVLGSCWLLRGQSVSQGGPGGSGPQGPQLTVEQDGQP